MEEERFRRWRANPDVRAWVGAGWPGDPFHAHVEGARSVLESAPDGFDRIEDAIAWARRRSRVVLVGLHGEAELRSAGEQPPPSDPHMAQWPPLPGELPQADRIPWAWEITAELAPPANLLDDVHTRAACDAQVAEIAEAAGAAAWDAEQLNAEVSRRRRARSSNAGWCGSAVAYRLEFAVLAITREAAEASVAARLTVPPGWELTFAATGSGPVVVNEPAPRPY